MYRGLICNLLACFRRNIMVNLLNIFELQNNEFLGSDFFFWVLPGFFGPFSEFSLFPAQILYFASFKFSRSCKQAKLEARLNHSDNQSRLNHSITRFRGRIYSKSEKIKARIYSKSSCYLERICSYNESIFTK